MDKQVKSTDLDFNYITNPFSVSVEPDGKARDVLIKSLKNVLATSEGRTVVWSFLGATEFFNDYVTNEPIDLARQQGMRQVGHWLLRVLEEADPMAFARMQLEVAEKQAVERLKREKGEEDHYDDIS